MFEKQAVREGMKVRARDGEDLGKIVSVSSTGIVIEKGFFFPRDYEVPMHLLSDVRDDELWLSCTKEDLKVEGALTGGAARTSELRSPEAGTREEGRMQLSEEELEARKHVRDRGEVRVTKEVVTEHKQLDVPVMHEEVRVERIPASGTEHTATGAFEEKTISVPVRDEEVEVVKRPRVREEVRVSKTSRVQEQRVSGDVRREEARIEGEGDLERDPLSPRRDPAERGRPGPAVAREGGERPAAPREARPPRRRRPGAATGARPRAERPSAPRRGRAPPALRPPRASPRSTLRPNRAGRWRGP